MTNTMTSNNKLEAFELNMTELENINGGGIIGGPHQQITRPVRPVRPIRPIHFNEVTKIVIW